MEITMSLANLNLVLSTLLFLLISQIINDKMHQSGLADINCIHYRFNEDKQYIAFCSSG